MPGADVNSYQTKARNVTNIKILLASRLAIISFFMGIVVFYSVKFGAIGESIPSMEPVGAAYLLTIFYAIYLRFVANPLRFAYFQLSVDLLLVTWIIYYTGGVNSPFSFMFILIIIASAYFRIPSGPYALATASSVLYGSLLSLEHLGLIKPLYAFPPLSDPGNFYYVFLNGVIHITTFYLVAFMSGYFTGLLSKTDLQLMKKSEDFTMLKAFHENVLNSMGLGFLAIDLDRTILSHNPASERILRLGKGDILRKSAEEVLGLPDLVSFFSHLDNMKEYARHFDWTYNDQEGVDIQLSMTLSKFVASNSTHGVIAVFQDITNLKTLEKQVADSERLAAIGRVAAGIAHEIRNPLASLSGSIQVLSSDLGPTLESQSARLMDIIMRETDRLNNIIGQFLGYASPPIVNPMDTDISQLLSETMTLLKSNPEYSGKIRFVSDYPPDLKAYVDQEGIRQVIWNLSVNGIDSMVDGGTLTIKAQKGKMLVQWIDIMVGPSANGDGHVDCVLLTVQDTGEGIAKENLEKIFEPFYTTKSNGTGLGLPTVHKIVQIHKGKIETLSEPGIGTTFTVWLPANKIGSHHTSSMPGTRVTGT